MNYKVGDKVKLLPISKLPNKKSEMHFAYSIGKTRQIYLAPDMEKFFGKEVTIARIYNDDIFKIKEDGSDNWSYLFDWIESKTPRGNKRC